MLLVQPTPRWLLFRRKITFNDNLSTASKAMRNWEYQIMSENSSAIIVALAENSLANTLADELRSHTLIGAAVHAKATSYGPGITEYWRVKQIITAMLDKIELNPQRYYDFINVLQLDRIRVDAEAALALLPTGKLVGLNLIACTSAVIRYCPINVSNSGNNQYRSKQKGNSFCRRHYSN